MRPVDTPLCPTSTDWFKASASTNAEACVEVRFSGHHVLIRDSKDNASGPIITVPLASWDEFLAYVAGDRPEDLAPLRIALAPDSGTLLRSPSGDTTLSFTATEWAAFLDGVLVGEFDRTAAA